MLELALTGDGQCESMSITAIPVPDCPSAACVSAGLPRDRRRRGGLGEAWPSRRAAPVPCLMGLRTARVSIVRHGRFTVMGDAYRY